MDADDEDPDSAAPVLRSVFYGLWPRFTADEPERADADGVAAATFHAPGE